MEESEYLKFKIVQAFALSELGKLKVWLRNDEELIRDLARVGLKDAQVLHKMMVKEIKEHNSMIEKKVTLLEGLSYRKSNWTKSKLISGFKIPWRKISNVIKENPDNTKDWYELYQMVLHEK